MKSEVYLHYKNLIQFTFIGGKKKKITNLFRKNFKVFLKKNKNINVDIKNRLNWKKLIPYVGLSTKKIGKRKKILVPQLLNEKKSLFLLYNWLIIDIKKKSKKYFFYNIINELNQDFCQSDYLLKKKRLLYNQLYENIYNLKRRNFYNKNKRKKFVYNK